MFRGLSALSRTALASSSTTTTTAASAAAAAAAAAARWSSKLSSEQVIELDAKYGANNYASMKVVFERADGVNVWDPEGNHYYDFLSAYSALNQGHIHPRILETTLEQAKTLTLASRAYYNNTFPPLAAKMCSLFGYESMLPMNTGAEAVETAIKLSRKWAYDVKGVAPGQAQIISACGCFHGRTMGVVSMSCDPDCTQGFGPMLPGNLKVSYGDAKELADTLEQHGPNTAAVLLEPIQGEAGVVVPPEGYLRDVRALCDEHNVLFVDDEIQTGIARTGRMLAVDHEDVRPDVVILGKALGGGVYPVSAVLADRDIMDVFTPGTHGSTFGGNPLGAAVASVALDVVVDEDLAAAADAKGKAFRSRFRAINSPLISEIRGKGLLNAFVMDTEALQGASATTLCYKLKDAGVLAKPTHGHIIRLAPPLTITDAEMDDVCTRIETTLASLASDIAAGKYPVSAPDPDAVVPRCERCGKDSGF